MCLLVHHKPDTEFTLEHLRDFFNKNSDGFGALVNQGGGVKVIKTVGNLDEIHELYNNEIKGHEAVIHFRMKTHGDIDLFNCHPYQVTQDLWMAHNGILSTGNTADISKSDTWHYIENYLKPLLARDPQLIHEPAFQKLIESHIGYTNKFGFMDGSGKVIIINRQAGVEHFGAWLSNTYAWTPGKWGYYSSYSGGYTNNYASAQAADRYNKYYAPYTSGYDPETNTWTKGQALTRKEKKAKRKAKKFETGGTSAKPVAKFERLSTESLGKIVRSCYNAMEKNPYGGITDWVIQNPMKAMHMIYEFYPEMFSREEISDMVNSDPDEAAAIIEETWGECGEDMMAIAKIPFTIKQGDLYDTYDI